VLGFTGGAMNDSSSSLLDSLSSELSNLFLCFLAGFLALVALAMLEAIAVAADGLLA